MVSVPSRALAGLGGPGREDSTTDRIGSPGRGLPGPARVGDAGGRTGAGTTCPVSCVRAGRGKRRTRGVSCGALTARVEPGRQARPDRRQGTPRGRRSLSEWPHRAPAPAPRGPSDRARAERAETADVEPAPALGHAPRAQTAPAPRRPRGGGVQRPIQNSCRGPAGTEAPRQWFRRTISRSAACRGGHGGPAGRPSRLHGAGSAGTTNMERCSCVTRHRIRSTRR